LTWLTDPWGPGAPFTLDPVEQLQAKVTASLEQAATKANVFTDTSSRIATMVGATFARPLVRVRLPFTMTYTDVETGTTVPVRFAMLRRSVFPHNTRILGTGPDTARVNILDSTWMPGDTLWAIHKYWKDSTIVASGTRVTVVGPETAAGTPGFRPIRVEVDSVGLNKFVVSCLPGNVSVGPRSTGFFFELSTCNPMVIGSRGATPAGGYLPVQPGWREYFELTRTFDARSEIALTALPFTTSPGLLQAALAKVRVVPNPYVLQTDMDVVGRGTPARVMFTGVPEQGTLRVYSVSGEWIQELNWTAADLTYQGNITTTGDLPFALKTRGGHDMSSGLYLYVLTATGPNGGNQVHRGKFVIIR
jgi:hypothetical protein